MLSAFELSRKLQTIRLHHWRRERGGIDAPDGLDQMADTSQVEALTHSILAHDLKESGFSHTMEFDWDYCMFRVELPEVAEIVDRACERKLPFPSVYFPPPRRERPMIQLNLYDQGLWCMDQQANELRNDLALYRELEAQVNATELPADLANDSVKRDLVRNLEWNRHVRHARTTLQVQRSRIQDMIAAHAPNLDETQEPVRVEVAEGQSLEEALFLALHNATG